jgi:hypothetical protein
MIVPCHIMKFMADKSITNWLIPHIHEADDFITQQDGMPPHIYLKV